MFVNFVCRHSQTSPENHGSDCPINNFSVFNVSDLYALSTGGGDDVSDFPREEIRVENKGSFWTDGTDPDNIVPAMNRYRAGHDNGYDISAQDTAGQCLMIATTIITIVVVVVVVVVIIVITIIIGRDDRNDVITAAEYNFTVYRCIVVYFKKSYRTRAAIIYIHIQVCCDSLWTSLMTSFCKAFFETSLRGEFTRMGYGQPSIFKI